MQDSLMCHVEEGKIEEQYYGNVAGELDEIGLLNHENVFPNGNG